MILRRLMMVPRFCFSEAVQSIEGSCSYTKDTSPPPSPTPPPEDTLALCSLPHPKAVLSKPWLTI